MNYQKVISLAIMGLIIFDSYGKKSTPLKKEIVIKSAKLTAIRIDQSLIKGTAVQKRNVDTTKKGMDAAAANISQSPSSSNVVDYSGFYKWNNYVQIYPCEYSPDSNTYVPKSLSIASDIQGEFIVQDILPDKNGIDTDVIIKYLFYLKDKKSLLRNGETKSEITNDVFFQRYNFNGADSAFNNLSSEDKISRNFGIHQKYFLVKLTIFAAHAVKMNNKVITKGSIGFGVLNYPFKFRIQKHIQDFNGSFNVGAAIAYTIKHDSLKKWSLSGVFGFGISSITLDKASVSTIAPNIDSSNGLTGLTFSFGAMLAYDKLQIGLFFGFDRISNLNNQTYGWKYQGNPWFSVGLGYSIFSTSSTTQTQNTDTQTNR